MILLNEVARKLQNILNGQDSEVGTNGSVVQATNPTDYEFIVYTQGFHIDKVYDQNSGKNFIPVFLASMGGQYNPVPALKQATYTIPVAMYFPVRFKEDFFAINDFLASAFVGTNLTYGTNSGKAISNISVSQYGEIQEMDLDQFKEWVEEKYRRAINIHEPWMTLNFTLYLSTAGSTFVWGNGATISLSTKINTTTYTDTDVAFVQSSIQSQTQSVSQQKLGTYESAGFPFGTSYGSGFSVYVKDTSFYQQVVEKWFAGTIQNMTFDLSISFLGKTFTRTCYVESMNLVIQKGQLATITFAFAKVVS